MFERRVDNVYDPSQATRDLTVRFDMEVEEDWGPDLEAFCRLRRLGRFREAKQHFKARLQHLSTIPYLWVQYADMLQAAGDYEAVRRMPALPESFPASEWNSGPITPEHQDLHVYFMALKLMERYPPLEVQALQSADQIVEEVVYYFRHEKFAGSTKVRPFSQGIYCYG